MHFDNILLSEVGYLLDSDNLEYRFDEWKAGRVRTLLLLGLSGAGKTTLADRLHKRYRASWLMLDYLDDLSRKEDPGYNMIDELQHIGISRIVRLAPKGPVVIDGIQLAFLDPEEARKCAIVVVGTSLLRSNVRSFLRGLQKHREFENPAAQLRMNTDLLPHLQQFIAAVWGPEAL